MGWAGQVASMREKRNAYGVVGGKPESKKNIWKTNTQTER